MNNPLFQRSDLDEVVFENRNKAYGAYALRKSYDANMSKAMYGTLSIFLLIGSWAFLDRQFAPHLPVPILRNTEIVKPEEHVFEIELPPAPAPDPQPAGTSGSSQNAPPKIVASTEIVPLAPRNIPNAAPGPGPASRSLIPSLNPDTIVRNALPFIPPAHIVDLVSSLPVYRGGAEEMNQYLLRHIIYPQQAYSVQKEGVVVVAFIVDADGNVGQVEVEKTLGFGCDEEAVRVVSGMPAWLPGKQNGKNVAVRLRLPVRFRIE